jgi:acyl-CoA synthetase (AMP-forming)/AMP-acid ligase II
MSTSVGVRPADTFLRTGAPDELALVDGARSVTFTQLRNIVDEAAASIELPSRSVVVVQMSATLESVSTYLALLDAGHVPLLAGDHHAELAAAWDAAAVVVDGEVRRRRVRTHPDVHPDLALLLSTSGSTGSPKLVRLSHTNVVSNATAIAGSLALGPTDRAITTLPLHYCYGLSVLHSHLAVGAGVVLTTASVVDPCFASALHDGAVTTVAGVPHTYQLLERAGPDRVHTPALRLMTQAGGRMPDDVLRTWRQRTRRWGVELVVMYGQTEATARIATMPPSLADRHPRAIGRAIPGGHLELRPVPDAPDGVGELVYRGPNVMMGYATAPADLAAEPSVRELVTGDLARHHADDDVFELVGRRSRFIKPFGLRIDLDVVERTLAADGIDAVVTGDDAHLVVCTPDAARDDVRTRLVARTGLPTGAITVVGGPVPRTSSGKVDHGALLGAAADDRPADELPARPSVAAVYTAVLGRSDVTPSSTFVTLGGDSLSYVECSIRLEPRLGCLPADWHLHTVADLERLRPQPGLPRVDTTMLLRTIGILAIVSTHMSLWYIPGGSHLLLAVVGYNTSRFHLAIGDRRRRAAAMLRSLARVVVPVVAFVAVCMLLVGDYGLPTLGLVNGYLGPPTHEDGRWHYWFVEVMAHVIVVLAVVLAIGPIHRAERRAPYLFPLALLAGALVLRTQWVDLDGHDNLRFQTHGVVWFFVLGWLVHRSTTVPLKLATSAVCVLTIPGFFDRPERDWFVACGLLLLVWCPRLPLPRTIGVPIAAVAAASMAIFVTHFRVFPVFDRNLPIGLAFAATVGAGIGIWWAVELVTRHGQQAWRSIHVRRRAVPMPLAA